MSVGRLTPLRESSGASNVEDVGGVAEQATGEHAVALVPDVLHVVRLVLDQRADGAGVDHLAVGRGALGRVDDGEEVRADQVLLPDAARSDGAGDGGELAAALVGLVDVTGPDQQVLLAGAVGLPRW